MKSEIEILRELDLFLREPLLSDHRFLTLGRHELVRVTCVVTAISLLRWILSTDSSRFSIFAHRDAQPYTPQPYCPRGDE